MRHDSTHVGFVCSSIDRLLPSPLPSCLCRPSREYHGERSERHSSTIHHAGLPPPPPPPSRPASRRIASSRLVSLVLTACLSLVVSLLLCLSCL
jgi:hypothetical protein